MRFALSTLAALLGVARPDALRAQDFPEQQRIIGDMLSAARVREARADALQRRRAQAAARAAEERTARQAALLEQQASEVRALRGELQSLRSERQLIAQADAFDAAVAARDGATLRSLLADTVVFEMPTPAGSRALAADALTAELLVARERTATGAPSRSGVQVSLDGDRAVLNAIGAAPAWAARSTRPTTVGEAQYRFVRSMTGWRIDGLAFRPRP